MYLRLLDSQAELALAREGSTGAHDNPHEARTRHCGLSAALVRWRRLGSSGASRGCTGVRTTLNARATRAWDRGCRDSASDPSGTSGSGGCTSSARRPKRQHRLRPGTRLPPPRLPRRRRRRLRVALKVGGAPAYATTAEGLRAGVVPTGRRTARQSLRRARKWAPVPGQKGWWSGCLQSRGQKGWQSGRPGPGWGRGGCSAGRRGGKRHRDGCGGYGVGGAGSGRAGLAGAPGMGAGQPGGGVWAALQRGKGSGCAPVPVTGTVPASVRRHSSWSDDGE